MKLFVATLLLAAVASAAPGGHWGHGAALAGPHTGPNHLVGPSNGPSSLAGPSVGPSRLSGAVDHGAVVTGAVTGPSSVHGSVDFGTHVDDHWGGPGPYGGWGGPGPKGWGGPGGPGGPWGGPWGGHGAWGGHGGWGHGAVLAGPHTGPAHISGPVAPAAVIKGPSGVIHAGGHGHAGWGPW